MNMRDYPTLHFEANLCSNPALLTSS